jgi:trk system potassium uptake protein TrkA
MRIVIVGAGVIGSNLARELSQEHEVYLVEQDKETADKVNEKLDVKVIVGNGSDPSNLTKAPIHDADMVIAVTTSDETNIVVCSLASAYGAKFKVARVRNASLARALKKYQGVNFDIDEIISPENLAAKAIVTSLKTPGAREVADFANGQILFRVFDIEEDSPLCGFSLGSLRDADFPWPFLIVAVMRKGKVFFAKGDTVLEKDDRIYVLLPQSSAGEFLTFVHPEVRSCKKVVIYGASRIGEILTAALSTEIEDVAVIEPRYAVAEMLATDLSEVRVIKGTAAEADILKECGIEAADVFIAVSTEDEDNLVGAMLAKKLGAKTTIITTSSPDYMRIIDAMDIDAVFNPRFLAVDQILKYVRGHSFNAVSSFAECDAEALELVPEEHSPITKEPLKNVNFPKDSLVGAIFRDNQVVLASGDLHIKSGEKVIVFCRESAVKKLQKLFVKK